MANIEDGNKQYWFKISGGDHLFAMIHIYPDEDHEPSISTQKADAIIRSYNPNLRLDDRYKLLNRTDGSIRCWVRRYMDNH